MSTAQEKTKSNRIGPGDAPSGRGGFPPTWVRWVGSQLWRYRKRPRHGIWAIGFTMIEMLIVLAIVGTILAIALPMLQASLDTARVARAIGDISALQVDIASFEAGGRGLPETLADVGRGGLVDPWGAPYRYFKFDCEVGTPDAKGKECKPSGTRKDRFLHPLNSSYDLYSVGKDGKTSLALTAKASKDDILRANDGGFIGLAVKY